MAQNAQLETAIIERPGDAARYAVYGDWLQAQGDPRGELVSVQAALASTQDTKRFLELKETEKRLLSTVTAELVPAEVKVELAWRFGFVHHVTFVDEKASVTALLQHPALRFVQAVRLALPLDDHSAALETVIAAQPPLLNRLELQGSGVQNLRAFRAAFPRLEHFVVEGHERTLFDAKVLLEWPELRTLELLGPPATSELCAVLRLAPWKKLRRVALRVSATPDRLLGIDDVSAVLALPELKSITLSTDVEGAVAAVAKRTNLSALQEFELLDFTNDARIGPLLRRKDVLRGLKLVVHQGELSAETVKQLRKAVKGLALGSVEVYTDEEAGMHVMDDEEARGWKERQERLDTQSDYNRDDWN